MDGSGPVFRLRLKMEPRVWARYQPEVSGDRDCGGSVTVMFIQERVVARRK